MRIETKLRVITATTGIIFLLFLLFVVGPIYTIDAGERGLLLTWGKITSGPVEPGLHYKIPFGVQSVERFSIQTQKYATNTSAASRDLQTVHTTIAIIYRLDANRIPEIYKTLGHDWSSRIIQPTVQEVVKATTAQFSADQLVTQRPLVAEKIKLNLTEELTVYGIIVENTAITDFEFSNSFEEAIEAKVTAAQQKQKAEMDLQRVKVEADMKIAQAKAEAESLRLQKEVVSENLIRLRTIEVQRAAIDKWNGVMPTYVGGNGVVPFIDLKNG
jgi:regulator of protease activity HflC (stomatin/prohibitin superfamily)